jgi:uncharacterized membrane protein YqjE
MPREDSSGKPSSGLGLFDSAKALLATLVAIAHNRLELLSTELQEEIGRVALMLLWGAIGLFLVFLGIAFLALVILIAFWDDHRLLVASVLAVLFVVLAVAAGFAAWQQIVPKPRPFDASLTELAKDNERLRSRP